jgi:hypothetical protein
MIVIITSSCSKREVLKDDVIYNIIGSVTDEDGGAIAGARIVMKSTGIITALNKLQANLHGRRMWSRRLTEAGSLFFTIRGLGQL